jgi:hypothetical protein
MEAIETLSFEEALRRLAAAARYRRMAREFADPATREALIETAAEFERSASSALAGH